MAKTKKVPIFPGRVFVKLPRDPKARAKILEKLKDIVGVVGTELMELSASEADLVSRLSDEKRPCIKLSDDDEAEVAALKRRLGII